MEKGLDQVEKAKGGGGRDGSRSDQFLDFGLATTKAM